MKTLRRLVAALAISSFLALGFSIDGAPTTAYAAGSASAGSLASFCPALASYIKYLDGLPSGPLRDFLLQVAHAAYDKYCS
jgi:hypothetical protein